MKLLFLLLCKPKNGGNINLRYLGKQRGKMDVVIVC